MNTGLLLIDIQNDYFPGGKMVLEGSPEASRNAGRVLAFFREKGWSSIHVQHFSANPGDASFFIPGTEGVKIHLDVQPGDDEMVVRKHYPNAFRDTSLLERLKHKDIGHLVIAGMMTHMCVDATVRAAFDHGFRCTVLHDACATRALSFGDETVPARQVHAAFLSALGAVYAKITATDDFLSAS
jgi:nicotinamidase-related amidase